MSFFLKIIFSFFFLFLLNPSYLFAQASFEHSIRRIQSHLIINDLVSARQEAEEALNFYPQESELKKCYIRVLAQLQDEKGMMCAWKNYAFTFPEKAFCHLLIEEMAWSVLCKASRSPSVAMRAVALLAAYYSEQTQSVSILMQGLQDCNYAVREVAVKLASHYRDHLLIEEIKRLFKEEKVWAVRKNVIAAIGEMQIKEKQGELENLISSFQTPAEEKILAIHSLLELTDQINSSEIKHLVSSSRFGLRQLACHFIAYFQSLKDVDQLIILTQDSNPSVRASAFQAIGQLHPQNLKENVLQLVFQGTKETNPVVAISAAWLYTLYMPKEGEQIFSHFLAHSQAKTRILAAAALASTGFYGAQAALYHMRHHQDPYVRLNLALGLIKQQMAETEALEVLNSLFFLEKDLWVEQREGIFKSFISNRLYFSCSSSHSEIQNHQIRLEILNLLAMHKYPKVEETIRQFLLERSWGTAALAATSLLMEGEPQAVEIIQKLLKDAHPTVRLQAALILSLWSREESAIDALEKSYQISSKEDKAKILEGIGRIGSMQSLPFLMAALEEPSQTLRVIAAFALIQCLNR